jgi:hypothetical protein
MAHARLLPATLLLTVAAATASACGSTDGSGASTGVATPSAPGATVTTTVTPQNPPAPTPTAPAHTRTTTTTTAPPAPAPADATTVVNAYFAAINARDFGRAWALGGKNLDSSYAHFVNGFSTTVADDVTILGSTPTTVTVRLAAHQSDGSVTFFEGTYTVAGGHIIRPAPEGLYENCTDAHEHGAYNIPRDDPAYQRKLDRDGDGVACEVD